MKKILPPTLFLICAIVMLLLHVLLPLYSIIGFPTNAIGIVPLVFGLGIAAWGSSVFARVGTSIKTFEQPQKLVTDGLFRYSRNPMYLGFVFALLGIAIALGTLSPLLGVMIFFLVADRGYIPYEENMLAQKFGQGFQTYQSKTRRWL